jgi:two-component system cell cycle sensor histidine kinase/response regulator CckA
MGENDIKRADRDVALSVAITLVLAAYRLLISFSGRLDAMVGHNLVEWLMNALFFWLLFMLWLAYRRWRKVKLQRDELQRIIRSISPDVLIVVDRSRQIRRCSGAVKAMFGYEAVELIDKQTDLIYKDRRVEGKLGEIATVLDDVGFHVGQATGLHQQGRTFPIELITGKLQDEQGVVILLRDITDRQRTEVALRASEKRFELFMEHLPAIASIKDSDGKFAFVNRHCLDLLGARESNLLGRTAFDVYPIAAARTFDANDKSVLACNSVVSATEEVEFNGKPHTLLTSRFPIPQENGETYLGAVAMDITDMQQAEEERRQIELQMQQTQKLESLGVLGGGIAHDFNNLLVGILGHAELAQTQTAPGNPASEHLQKVITTAKRAAELANQLLAYTGEGRLAVEPRDLTALVKEMSDLLNVSISKKVELVYELGTSLAAIECDSTQVRQIIMNLIVNASDAMGDEQGQVTLRTGVRRCRTGELIDVGGSEPHPEGDYVFLQVQDTGCGMDASTRSRIFDPFFTTKFTGRGLGLAALMGIIRSHRGAVTVDSTPGSGTIFTVYFPASSLPLPPAAVADATDELPWTGSGIVLVADDEDVVREVACSMLKALGYTCLTACNGREAVDIFKERHADIRAVLLDLTMPELSGHEVFAEIRMISSDMPVIISSGYSKGTETTDFETDTGKTTFLQKPYQFSALTQTFRTAAP